MTNNDLTLSKFGYTLNEAKTTDEICCICDYCSQEFVRKKRHLLQGRIKIDKDSCNKCLSLKIKEINILTYGVDSPIKNETVKNKIRQTNLDKYGTTIPSQNQEIKNKIKETNLERYGVECTLSNEDVKNKIKQTNLEKYGVDHYSKTDSCKNKIKQTNLERYGVDSPAKNPSSVKKRKETNLERYGVECTLSNEDVKNKIKQTNLEKYGVEYLFQSKDVQLQSIEERVKRYGSLHTEYGKTENEIKDFLFSLGFVFKPNYSILGGKEIDLYNEDLKLGIEYCGLFWHTEDSLQPRYKNYHYDKYLKCRTNNVRLITIFEDEWLWRKKQCRDYLKSVVGVFDKRIYARNCDVGEVDKKIFDSFCDENHIQGSTRATKISYGLFDDNCLVGVVGLGLHHRNSKTLVLNRLCFKEGFQIVGGASKLFSRCKHWCKINNVSKIGSWSDNRWSDGKIYEILHFKNVQNLRPDYSYVNLKKCSGERLSKQSCKKRSIKCPDGFTEKEWMNSLGYGRIWDCGKIRWEFSLNE